MVFVSASVRSRPNRTMEKVARAGRQGKRVAGPPEKGDRETRTSAHAQARLQLRICSSQPYERKESMSLKKLIMGGLTAVVGSLLFASVSAAAPHHPTGEYAPFADCPLNRVTITDCVLSTTNGGYFTIGKKTVPIKNPVTLQG